MRVSEVITHKSFFASYERYAPVLLRKTSVRQVCERRRNRGAVSFYMATRLLHGLQVLASGLHPKHTGSSRVRRAKPPAKALCRALDTSMCRC
jgi:hypothetical protein